MRVVMRRMDGIARGAVVNESVSSGPSRDQLDSSGPSRGQLEGVRELRRLWTQELYREYENLLYQHRVRLRPRSAPTRVELGGVPDRVHAVVCDRVLE